ncbi:hypothetical protein E2C01_072313 [Portunus trituberculatus]|uniref:Uncharacterized protein n=1 Tax=Portunus trituberculatus TaxID=210409 RepID=A0A5B7I6S8_PORTR|nr:hypothetical protein [Portunus trituberculatus]
MRENNKYKRRRAERKLHTSLLNFLLRVLPVHHNHFQSLYHPVGPSPSPQHLNTHRGPQWQSQVLSHLRTPLPPASNWPTPR